MTEIRIALTDDQWAELVAAEQAKAVIEEKKNMAIRFLLLAHAVKDDVDAALAAGRVRIQTNEIGEHVLAIVPGVALDAES